MKSVTRIWEIDFLRGIAILLMIVFHIIVDIDYFYSYSLEYLSFWYLEGKTAAMLFMFLSGISSTLSQNNVQRGCKVLLCGMILTGITYMYDTQSYIRFGILHFLGVSILSARWIKQLSYSRLAVIALGSIILGQYFDSRYTSLSYLFPIGLVTPNFSSLDYYPFLPWYSVFIVGVMIGKKLYQNNKQSYLFTFPLAQPIVIIGQYSLIVYLIHQPILLAFFYGIHKVV